MKKMFRSILLMLIMCTMFNAVQAQNDSLFRFLKKLDYPVSFFTVGNLGELFTIDINNQLKKYDEKGDSAGVYNQVTRHGRLSYVEAQNPWKVILYYQNFSTIVLLDKYLKEIGSINLRNKNIFRVKAVTTTYDNNIWLYDEQDNKLKKIDDSGNLLSETTDLRQLLDVVPTPQKIFDQDGFVYLYDPANGLYQFDYYGSFKQKFAFLNWKDFTVIGKVVYGLGEDHLYKYQPPLPELQSMPLPPSLHNSGHIRLANQQLYILKDKELSIYWVQ